MECRVEAIIRKCNCIPFYYPQLSGFSFNHICMQIVRPRSCQALLNSQVWKPTYRTSASAHSSMSNACTRIKVGWCNFRISTITFPHWNFPTEYFSSVQPPDHTKGFNATNLEDKSLGIECSCLPHCSEVV